MTHARWRGSRAGIARAARPWLGAFIVVGAIVGLALFTLADNVREISRG